MANFIRRFLFDPGVETLIEIESINILDLEPPAQITGVGSGTVIMIGEYENGEFAPTQREVTGSSDFRNSRGSFGYVYGGVEGNNPSARARNADLALNPEFWNGNAFVALANKRFSRLITVRVDTSIGEVVFTRAPCLLGGTAPTFALVTAQTLDFDPAGSGVDIVVFTGVPALLSSGAGTYATTFTGGETMNVTVDNGVAGQQIGPVDIIFQASDQLQVDVINRINQTLGFTCAIDITGDATSLNGRIGGTAGNFTINSIDAAVTTAMGASVVVGATAGTGNVANINTVTVAEINGLVVTASATNTTVVDRDADGKLRICMTNAALGAQTITIDAATTALALGFVNGASNDATLAADNIDLVIPAGTRVRNGAAVEFVTMQDLAVTAGSPGPYTVKVRHALDDGTGLTTIVGSVTVIPFSIRGAGFTINNLVPLSAALTEPQLDTAYINAIIGTKSLTQVAKEGNTIVSARQSNIIRTALRDSALEASAEGARGRIAVTRPPLGTTRADAQGDPQPGVGAYRDQRVVYAFPGVQTFISQMTGLGTSGGAGYTADGIIDVGFDSFIASVLSQLPPEENPGQQTTFLTGVLAIEGGNLDVQDLTIVDYTNFKRNGIAAPRFDDGVAFIQSGITSVNPLTQPNLKNIARRRMADFIQDTLALRLKSFGKKLNTRSRRAAIMSEVNAFLQGLQNDERIDSFSVIIGSDADEIALGIFRLIIKVRTLSSLDSIVLETTIGESVTIDEAA